MDADGMCMEMRDIHIHRQTDARTHLYTNTHKHINDDEDHEILRHPYCLCCYEKFLLSSEVLLEPYADATSIP